MSRRSKRPSPLWQLTLARWRAFYREPSAVFWTFGFPVVMAIALGIAFRNQPPPATSVAIEIPDPAHPPLEAERIRRALEASGEVHVELVSSEEAARHLRTGRASLVIEPATPRTYHWDPTRPEGRTARLLVDDLLQQADGRIDPTRTADVRSTAPGSRYIDFLIPGLLGMGLMSSGLWGIGYVLVDMRVRKLLKRMMATPMRKSHFLIAFVVMRAVFLVGELPVLLGFAHWAFRVPVHGSLVLLTSTAVLGALTFAALGLLVASRAANTQTVAGLVNLVTLPMSMVGGVFFAYERFPLFMQPVIRALPLTALIDALRAIMVDGAGLAQMGRPALILLAWALGSVALAMRLFRWR